MADTASATDITTLSAHFYAQQAWAAALLGGTLLLTTLGLRWLSRTRSSELHRGGMVVGKDGRLSTSRAMALLWTAVFGYCLLAITLIATAPVSKPPIPDGHIPKNFAEDAFNTLSTQDLVLLGGSFAAAVIAKVVTTQRTSNGSLQKAPTSRANILDIISDDQGDLDLVDLQYSLFNVIAAIYVITQFVPHPARGIPDLPTAFTVLTGASATLYAGNKGVATNPMELARLVPESVPAGGIVTLVGENLSVGKVDAHSPEPAASLVGSGAPDAVSLHYLRSSTRGVEFRVPRATPLGIWDVQFTSDAGVSENMSQGLVVTEAAASGSAEGFGVSTAGPLAVRGADGRGIDLELFS